MPNGLMRVKGADLKKEEEEGGDDEQGTARNILERTGYPSKVKTSQDLQPQRRDGKEEGQGGGDVRIRQGGSSKKPVQGWVGERG